MQLARLCRSGVQGVTQATEHEAPGQLVYGRAQGRYRERLRARLGHESQGHQRQRMRQHKVSPKRSCQPRLSPHFLCDGTWSFTEGQRMKSVSTMLLQAPRTRSEHNRWALPTWPVSGCANHNYENSYNENV